MAIIYKVSYAEGGRGYCGHKMKMGEVYYLLDGEKSARAYCKECGEKVEMRGKSVTTQRLKEMGVLSGKDSVVSI